MRFLIYGPIYGLLLLIILACFPPIVRGDDAPPADATSTESTDQETASTTITSSTPDTAPPVITFHWPDYIFQSIDHDFVFTASVEGGVFTGVFDGPAYHCVPSEENTLVTCTVTDNIYSYNFAIDLVAEDAAGNIAAAPPVLINTIHRALPSAPTPEASGLSNVLFLPGIEASRLYDADDKLWEPVDQANDSLLSILGGVGDARARDLFLMPDGTSVRNDIYTKDNDIVGSAAGKRYYASFIDQMNTLKDAGSIADWKPVSYDWRLSLPELVRKGTEHDGKIYYEEATSTPYIEQELRRLAESSKTGKVTIVAHSNGGLVAKALLQELGSADTAKLVDKVILVAVPQSGTPQAVGGLLFGLDEGIGAFFDLVSIVSTGVARALSGNAPAAYQSLPSSTYFSEAVNLQHAVATFEGAAYGPESAAYGGALDSWNKLADYLGATSLPRAKPSPADTDKPDIANTGLLTYAKDQHDALDTWHPPQGVTVYQIAGWGVDDTLSGIDFYTSSNLLSGLFGEGAQAEYRPRFTDDGDGVVPEESALMMDTDDAVRQYSVDLSNATGSKGEDIDHADILEFAAVRNLIQNILEITSASSTDEVRLPSAVSKPKPAAAKPKKKKTVVIAHNAASLEVTDAIGKKTSVDSKGTVTKTIPASKAGQIGDVKYAIIPKPTVPGPVRINIKAYDPDSIQSISADPSVVSLDLEELDGDTITASSTINIPASTTTEITLGDDIHDSTTTPSVYGDSSAVSGQAVVRSQFTQSAGSNGRISPSSQPMVLGTSTSAVTQDELRHRILLLIVQVLKLMVQLLSRRLA